MLPDPVFRFLVESLDVGLELPAVPSPDPAPAYLDAGQLVRADESVHLLDADRKVCRDVFQREKPGLDRGPRRLLAGSPTGARHGATVALGSRLWLGLTVFAPVWPPLGW